MAQKEFLHKSSSNCQMDADSAWPMEPYMSCLFQGKPSDMQKTHSARANRSKTLGYLIFNPQRVS